MSKADGAVPYKYRRDIRNNQYKVLACATNRCSAAAKPKRWCLWSTKVVMRSSLSSDTATTSERRSVAMWPASPTPTPMPAAMRVT